MLLKAKKKRFRKITSGLGFTLIELMTVVAVIGALAAVSFVYFGGAVKGEWKIKEASRNFFNDLVRSQATARARGSLTGIYMGSDSCTVSGANPEVYSYTRLGNGGASDCVTIFLPEHCRFGLPQGASEGPTTPEGEHAYDLDGATLSQNTLFFDSRGFATPIPTLTTDSIYLTCEDKGRESYYGRAIVIRPIGRPQFYKWSVADGWVRNTGRR